MQILYKYCSNTNKYSLDNLRNGLICFTPLETLNDPFEGIGLFKLSKSNSDFVNKFLVNQLSKRVPEDLIKYINFNFRVFCTSKKYDNPLLWSYYANSHFGYCVAYNKCDIERISDEISNINYVNDPYILNQESKNDLIHSLLFSKSTAWKHEDEVRAIYTITNEDKSQTQILIDKINEDSLSNEKIYTLSDSNKLIQSTKFVKKKCKAIAIYLGVNINIEDQIKLLDIAKELNIDVYKMILSSNSFGFEEPQKIFSPKINCKSNYK